MKKTLALLGFALLGCAHVAPVPPESRSIPLNQSKTKAFSSVLKALATDGFVIKSAQKESWLINTEPREFKISRGLASIPWPASAEAQIIFSDGDATAQLVFKCAYSAHVVDLKQFQACSNTDSEAARAIETEKRRIMSIIEGSL